MSLWSQPEEVGTYHVTFIAAILKYYSHIDCQNWAKLAGESYHLKIFNN